MFRIVFQAVFCFGVSSFRSFLEGSRVEERGVVCYKQLVWFQINALELSKEMLDWFSRETNTEKGVQVYSWVQQVSTR